MLKKASKLLVPLYFQVEYGNDVHTGGKTENSINMKKTENWKKVIKKKKITITIPFKIMYTNYEKYLKNSKFIFKLLFNFHIIQEHPDPHPHWQILFRYPGAGGTRN